MARVPLNDQRDTVDNFSKEIQALLTGSKVPPFVIQVIRIDHLASIGSQMKNEHLAAIALLGAYLEREPNTRTDTNFELVQCLGAVLPPAPSDLEVIEAAAPVFGLHPCIGFRLSLSLQQHSPGTLIQRGLGGLRTQQYVATRAERAIEFLEHGYEAHSSYLHFSHISLF